MGNSQHRYITNNEASEIIGGTLWKRVQAKLERGQIKTVDFNLFSNIIHSRYERIPNILCEALFKAFSNDLNQRIEIDAFISSYAVLFGEERNLLLKFIFRVYESGSGLLERKRCEEIFQYAYGDRLKEYTPLIYRTLDQVFTKKKLEISSKEFKQYTGRIDLFLNWIEQVLSVFIEALPTRLVYLQRKYSTHLEMNELMHKFQVNNDLYYKLQHQFQLHAGNATTLYKPELTLDAWKQWVSPYFIHEFIAEILFHMNTQTFKPNWKFIDFIEFCLTYNAKNMEIKVNAIVKAFLKYGMQEGNNCGSSSGDRTIGGAKIIDNHYDANSGMNGLQTTTIDEEGEYMFDEDGEMIVSSEKKSPPLMTSVPSKNPDYDPRFSEILTAMIYFLTKPLQLPKLYPPNSTPTTGNRLHSMSIDSTASTDDYHGLNNSVSVLDTSGIHEVASTTNASPGIFRKRSYSLNHPTSVDAIPFAHASTEPSIHISSPGLESTLPVNTGSSANSAYRLTVTPQQLKKLPIQIQDELQKIHNDYNETTTSYVQLLLQKYDSFPVLNDLSLLTCCLFGMLPNTPTDEKAFITELTIRYHKQYPFSSQQPYGPADTEWCIVPKAWYDAWRLYVGKNRTPANSPTASSNANLPPSNTNVADGSTAFAPRPLAIENWHILKKSGNTKGLMPDLRIGQEIEVIPPLVYYAFSIWYGGGPCITRRVITSKSEHTLTEIELYPLSIYVMDCDAQGKMILASTKEMLFSKTVTIQEMITEIAEERQLSVNNIRLWNYAKDHWKEQYILSPELTLTAANIADGQKLLIEISLPDGTWPRSQLHTTLNNEEKAAAVEGNKQVRTVGIGIGAEGEEMEGVEIEVDDEDDEEEGAEVNDSPMNKGNMFATDGESKEGVAIERKKKKKRIIVPKHQLIAQAGGVQQIVTSPIPSSSGSGAVSTALIAQSKKRNGGLVGLDNLGNTCYFNSSLQALLHTDLLMEYYLSQMYLQDVNTTSKHGFHGRIAHSFGKLVNDLWSSNGNSINPRAFFQEIQSLHEQFAGNEQHDSHELLVFLLDGLAEDLNRVITKPYIEHPDSDNRPDEELAAIWWGNHLQRDRSVIQALFTGQFKSVMSCSHCGYTSARFEPFNFLSIPIPEDTHRVMNIIVVPRHVERTMRCAIKVNKQGTLQDVLQQIKLLDLFLPGYTPQNKSNKSTNNSTQPGAVVVYDDMHFVVGEYFNTRIKNFLNVDRKVSTIRDNELLIIFQVLALPKRATLPIENNNTQVSSSAASSAVSSPVKPKMLADDHAAELSDNDEAGDRLVVEEQDEEFNRSRYVDDELAILSIPKILRTSSDDAFVRVAFCQRRVQYVDGVVAGVAGYDFFRLEPFGLPILEVIPSKVTGADLYRLMAHRLRSYLKASVTDFITNQQQMTRTMSSMNSTKQLDPGINTPNASPPDSLVTAARSNSWLQFPSFTSIVTTATNHLAQSEQSDISGELYNLGTAPSDRLTNITSLPTDEIIGGAIPSKGFTLRFITGGGNNPTVTCSRCPWITRCQGCVLPDNETIVNEFLDGESVAIDWHYIILEELVDGNKANSLPSHPSVQHEKQFLVDNKIPITKCMEKFHEQEKLEGIICGKCHEENTLSKYFELWRLPPILIIQLKRFQFDRTSRKKLIHNISFPVDGFNVESYLATTRQQLRKEIMQKKLLELREQQRREQREKSVINGETDQSNGENTGGVAGTSRIGVHDSVYLQNVLGAGGKSNTSGSGTSSPYPLSPTAESQNHGNGLVLEDEGLQEILASVDVDKLFQEMDCTMYDLYCVIHHIGALSGGHYVAAVRLKQSSGNTTGSSQLGTNGVTEKLSKKKSPFSFFNTSKPVPVESNTTAPNTTTSTNTATTASSSSSNSANNTEGSSHSNHNSTSSVPAVGTGADKWYCFNDHLVTEITNIAEVSASSAYVLFYIRKDVQHMDIQSILSMQLGTTRLEEEQNRVDALNRRSEQKPTTQSSTGRTIIPVKKPTTSSTTTTTQQPTATTTQPMATTTVGGGVSEGSTHTPTSTIPSQNTNAKEENNCVIQ